MGDATHDAVAALRAAGLEMAAGYVTGGPGIQWTSADFALFAGTPVVTIDQGFTGSPVLSADVRDVEAGAWTAAAAVDRTGWTAPRPTIYTSLNALPALAAAGWKGDVWVADYTFIPPAVPPPVPAGMNCVAMQYSDLGGGGAYDLSAVFDPAWPAKPEDPMYSIPGLPAGNEFVTPPAYFIDTTTGTPIVVGQGTDGTVFMTKYVSGAWTPFVRL